MALSCIFSHIQPAIGRKSRNLYTPPVFNAPIGVAVSEFRNSVAALQFIIYIINAEQLKNKKKQWN